MGIDWNCFPVQLDAAPVRRLRSDSAAWQAAIDHAPFTSLPSESLPDISRELLAMWPDGLKATWLFSSRSHGKVEYLLDPAGYRSLETYERRERSMPYRIVYGDEVFAEHARGGQGHPWRCSSAAFLSAAADVIDALDVPAVRRQFSIAEMANESVYKAFGRGSDDEEFAVLLDEARTLGRYYREVAARGQDLIIQQV